MKGIIRLGLLGIEDVERGLGSITDLTAVASGPAQGRIVISTRLGLWKRKNSSWVERNQNMRKAA